MKLSGLTFCGILWGLSMSAPFAFAQSYSAGGGSTPGLSFNNATAVCGGRCTASGPLSRPMVLAAPRRALAAVPMVLAALRRAWLAVPMVLTAPRLALEAMPMVVSAGPQVRVVSPMVLSAPRLAIPALPWVTRLMLLHVIQ